MLYELADRAPRGATRQYLGFLGSSLSQRVLGALSDEGSGQREAVRDHIVVHDAESLRLTIDGHVLYS